MTRSAPDLRRAAPHPSGSAEALGALDRAFFQWHRMALKGEMMGRLLDELGIDLEVGQFRALGVLGRIREAGGSPTVGRLAEELALDPSRASRIAADLVARGYVAREAAQDDGRKTVLAVTPLARRELARFGELRRAKQAEVFADWPEGDVAAFARLFAAYVEGVERVCRGEP